ncbi:putative toxin-antitoxin system toxin component, PIN family [Polynucleobacter sp. AP-Kolm-20A-A1]|uniref:putative toxin-antitoxin system toxin component, PIN family n=1 Tax=Polynucleobacter sp. AP-Kolm-20A-A1 TaxID=2081041 RepID=UPI001BFDBA6E|nr:putative toxin-antitoxin system toxin component, PIN family [Polynucleobacter sp. AP-Kolm-20A-A1]QWE20035.1 putative toxin-antitoxin system toxin component, PIN family [Polynucleobacter sp. AP-Kolm-20A-A1]
MRVVILDTNVLLDLFVFNDFRALHLKEALLARHISALATPKTLEEFADVISRPLFSLDQTAQEKIFTQWSSLAKIIGDEDLQNSPWQCQDPDDQVFLDLAYTHKPCTLVSKDNEVLKFASKAAKEQILITADYTQAL